MITINTLMYKGILNDDLRVGLLETFINTITAEFNSKVNPKPVANIVVEMLDNSQRYSFDGRTRMTWWLENDNIYCQVRNRTTTGHANKLKSEVERVSRLSKAETIAEHRRLMQNETFNEDGGAGMGLLQMKRSGAEIWPVQVEVESLTVAVCTHTIQAKINRT